jgi:hypothetical protein
VNPIHFRTALFRRLTLLLPALGLLTDLRAADDRFPNLASSSCHSCDQVALSQANPAQKFLNHTSGTCPVLPFGLLSIPIIRSALRRWPATAAEGPMAIADPQSAHEADAARSV